MRDIYQEQINSLGRELIQMGQDCVEIMELAVLSLGGCTDGNSEKAGKLGAQIDESEHRIESLCLRLLLRQQPVAGDLREISAALKMISDLERIGDQAEDIVEIAPYVSSDILEKLPLISEMASETLKMVRDSLRALEARDMALARAVMEYDDVVDDCFDRIKGGIIGMISTSPAEGEAALDLLMIAKYFERIGDHCTNVAEWIVFSLTGEHKDCQ